MGSAKKQEAGAGSIPEANRPQGVPAENLPEKAADSEEESVADIQKQPGQVAPHETHVEVLATESNKNQEKDEKQVV